MGGKGQRRREKNYLSAHGGESRLPPPPKLAELEAIPFKLRKIMEFRNNPSSINKLGHHPSGKDGRKDKKKGHTSEEKKLDAKSGNCSPDIGSVAGERIKGAKLNEDNDDQAAVMNSSTDEKKKKRKRKGVKDLRFLELDQATSSRKQKRKEYREAKKKKQKKAKTDDIPEFPGREKVQFGDVVQAPPKLSIPKALNVYRERIRLDTVEAYRKHKGWNSRPGIKLQVPEIAP